MKNRRFRKHDILIIRSRDIFELCCNETKVLDFFRITNDRFLVIKKFCKKTKTVIQRQFSVKNRKASQVFYRS